MFIIGSNVGVVAAWLGRLQAGYGAAVVERWGGLDPGLFRAAAQGALTSAMLPEEFKWLKAMLATVAVVLPGDGELEVSMGRPPSVVDRAVHAAGVMRGVFNRGRPGYLGKGIGRTEAEDMELRSRGATPEQLAEDHRASRQLIRAWLEEPFTDRADPASGKERKDIDAGLTNVELEDRLAWILGLDPSQKKSFRTKEMEAAAASLARALGKFAREHAPDTEGIAEGRLRDLFRAVLTSWRALLRQQLPKAAHDALLDAREG